MMINSGRPGPASRKLDLRRKSQVSKALNQWREWGLLALACWSTPHACPLITVEAIAAKSIAAETSVTV
jgi:hypothetical protein